MVTLPKFTSVGLGVNRPAEIPVPERGIVRFGFEAFETTVIAPARPALDVWSEEDTKSDALSLIQAQGQA